MNPTSRTSALSIWRVRLHALLHEISHSYRRRKSVSAGIVSRLCIQSSLQVFVLDELPTDATGIENYLLFGREDPSPESHIVKRESGLTTIPASTEELWICRFDCTKVLSWELSGLQMLRVLVLGNRCLIGLNDLRLNDMDVLERVSVKSDCCFGGKGCFHISKCPKLCCIQIGNCSFPDYQSLELEELPSLESVEIGEQCFYEAPLFSLTGLMD